MGSFIFTLMALIEEIAANMQKMMEEHGWVAHHVFDDQHTPWGVNVHTHGFPDKFQHPDVQIVMPMDYMQAQGILWATTRYLEAHPGVQLTPGTLVHGIIDSYPVECISAWESGRPVVRLCFPDVHGQFRTGALVHQYENLGVAPAGN